MPIINNLDVVSSLSYIKLIGEHPQGGTIYLPLSGVSLSQQDISVDANIAIVPPPSAISFYETDKFLNDAVVANSNYFSTPLSGFEFKTPSIDIDIYEAIIAVPENGVSVSTGSVDIKLYSAIIETPSSTIEIGSGAIEGVDIYGYLTTIPLSENGIFYGSEEITSTVFTTPTSKTGSAVFASENGIGLGTPEVSAEIKSIPVVDNTQLTFWTSGDLPWEEQDTTLYPGWNSETGWKAGAITDSQSSNLSTFIDVSTAGTLFTFAYKVSSEDGYDFLNIYQNGSLIESFSGVIAYTVYSISLGVGTHNFEWKYEKDSSVSGNQDTAWLDFNIEPTTDFTGVLPSFSLEIITKITAALEAKTPPIGLSSFGIMDYAGAPMEVFDAAIPCPELSLNSGAFIGAKLPIIFFYASGSTSIITELQKSFPSLKMEATTGCSIHHFLPMISFLSSALPEYPSNIYGVFSLLNLNCKGSMDILCDLEFRYPGLTLTGEVITGISAKVKNKLPSIKFVSGALHGGVGSIYLKGIQPIKLKLTSKKSGQNTFIASLENLKVELSAGGVEQEILRYVKGKKR